MTSDTIVMGLVERNDAILRTPLETFDFRNPPIDPEELSEALVGFMRDNAGLGLAANQVGLPYRAFSIEGEPAHVCFNPRVVVPGDEKIFLEEGCLSYPGLFVKVKRPKTIKVRFEGPDGETYTKTFTGMTARIFQHELDHLDGILFYERANRLHREQAFKKWKLAKRRA